MLSMRLSTKKIEGSILHPCPDKNREASKTCNRSREMACD